MNENEMYNGQPQNSAPANSNSSANRPIPLAVLKKLGELQSKLYVNKDSNNNYGGYKYRSAEDIFMAVKPLLSELGLSLVLKDEVIRVGDVQMAFADGRKTLAPNTYIKATATLVDLTTGEYTSTEAYAHECEHKGMSADQATGTASSYARKYALNAMFLIASKDSDACDNTDNGGYYNQNSNNGGYYNQNNSGGYNNNGGYNNGGYNKY